jgi:hypothetical protein
VKALAQSALAFLFVGVLGFMATGAFAQSLDPVSGATSTVTDLPSTITGTASTGTASTLTGTTSTVTSTASTAVGQVAATVNGTPPDGGSSPTGDSPPTGSPSDETGGSGSGARDAGSTGYRPGMTCGEAARDQRAFAAWMATFKEQKGYGRPAPTRTGSGIAGASAQGAASAANLGLPSVPALPSPGEDGLRRILEILALATVAAGLLALTVAAASFLTGRWSP